jgi:hypothetical protein
LLLKGRKAEAGIFMRKAGKQESRKAGRRFSRIISRGGVRRAVWAE